MRRYFNILFVAFFAFLWLVCPVSLEARQDFEKLKRRSEHGNMVHGSLINTAGCAYCHRTGVDAGEEWTCLVCHSAANERVAEPRGRIKRSQAMKQSVLAKFPEKEQKLDVLSVYRKAYTHPTLTINGVHQPWEELSGNNEATRHAECPDCHHRHEVSQFNKLGPITVVKKTGREEPLKALSEREMVEPVRDYELCFKCHADNVNLPVDQTNKRLDFDENNPSYHPVLAEGRNGYVPSLMAPYNETYKTANDITIISCSDCHNNNDERGPQGPHGSDFRYILKRRYSTEDGMAESPKNYDLCYGCHSRSSILGDMSFKKHSLHINGSPLTGSRGTSCYTCHDAHGSREYPHLIRFNRDVVFQNPSTLEVKFVDGDQDGEGECSLLCHEVNHNPKTY